jgi:hypothetical protein
MFTATKRTLIAVAVIAAAVAPSAAHARYYLNSAPASSAPAAHGASAQRIDAHRTPPVYSRQDKSIVPAGPTSTSGEGSARVSAPPPVVRVEAPDRGFHWGDAGIGAAVGLALSMVTLGGTLVMLHRRTRRTRHSTALTS